MLWSPYMKPNSLSNLIHRRLKCPEVNCVTDQHKGDPREALSKAIDELNPTVLIMGTRGRGLLKRYKSATKIIVAMHLSQVALIEAI